ncbi:MAG: hypothetical protein NC408_04445 [Candidatus Gastranaerophilales bacterium]|nr:hypothetical protein [Candidatus Gastranaerophilales bacterium]MCM1072279.1 hypothetical protein [Bacteroides sp.]
MTVTAQRLLTELGRRAWSGFNADDMDFDSEDSLQAQTELNFALRYLINLEDFPFKAKEHPIETDNGVEFYTKHDGQITNIYNVDTLESLQFIGDSTDYDKEAYGEPTHFWINYNNPKQQIRLYPIPNEIYNYNAVYNQYMPIIDKGKKVKKFEFENADDFINMPENLEFLFMDCVVLRTMITNNKDDQDENYQPMIKEFEEAWKVFKRACKPVRVENRVLGL